MYLRYSKCEDAHAGVSPRFDYLITFTKIIKPGFFKTLLSYLADKEPPATIKGENVIVYGTHLHGWKHIDGRRVSKSFLKMLHAIGPRLSFVSNKNFFDVTQEAWDYAPSLVMKQ